MKLEDFRKVGQKQPIFTVIPVDRVIRNHKQKGDMEKVPVTLLPVIEIHHTDLEKLVKQAYGFDINFEFITRYPKNIGVGYRVEELGYFVEGKLLEANPRWKERADKVRRGRRTGNIELLLNVLAADGFIHRGRWIVRTGPKPIEKFADHQPWEPTRPLVEMRVAIARLSKEEINDT